jgi:hypothetical protein
MFRNLAIAIVSVCAVSTGSPAWSQNTQDQPDLPPSVDQQFTQSDIGTLRENCQKRLTRNKDNQQLYCTGEEARLLFKILNEFKTTEAVAVDGTSFRDCDRSTLFVGPVRRAMEKISSCQCPMSVRFTTLKHASPCN